MSLQDLPKNDARTKTPLRVTVLHTLPARKYENAQKKQTAVVEAVVADNTGYSKLLCYNKLAFPMIKNGQALMMLNAISKAKEIVATSDAKFLLIPNISVEEDIITSARQLIDEMIHPPLAQHKTVLEAYDLPPGSLVNVRVQAVEADDVKTVTTSYGAETEVRNGVFGDENGAMPFAFWRRLASAQIAVGDCIRVNNAVLSKTTDGNPKLSGNQRTTIEFLSRNAIQAVRGSSRYEEEGEIVAISSVNLYSSCKRQACFQKKLIENKCPKCLIDYSGESSAVSVMCSVAIQQHDEIETKILFTPQVIELLNNEQFSLHSKEEVEKKDILQVLPAKVGFTKSPRKYSNTLC